MSEMDILIRVLAVVLDLAIQHVELPTRVPDTPPPMVATEAPAEWGWY